MFYSQAKQDEWVCKVLNNKKNGYFLDVGAYDGKESSNTLYLEEELGWTGICVEPEPVAFQKLKSIRKSICIESAVLNYKGECYFGQDTVTPFPNRIIVKCNTLNNILKENNAPKNIDYLSIDIEGSEYTALKDFNFYSWNINLITIEHNLYRDGYRNKNQLFELLTSKGFERVVDNAPDPRGLPYEDWYVSKRFLNII